ncbi:MAG: hypothetical protein V1809_08730 [Planctomycetota bacterium]
MPTEAAHIALAARNQKTIDYLLNDISAHSEWITTIAFYRALHIVEALFSKDPRARHGTSHERRDHLLKSDKRYSHIYKHYRPLWAASVVARYLEDRVHTYGCFSEYLTPEQIKTEILGHRLCQIEKSAKKLLPSLSPEVT